MIVSVSPSTQVDRTVVAQCHLHGALDPLTQPSAEGIGVAGNFDNDGGDGAFGSGGQNGLQRGHDLLVQREARRYVVPAPLPRPSTVIPCEQNCTLHFTPTGQEFIPTLGNGGGITATAQRATPTGTMGFPPDTTCAVPHAVRPGHRSVQARLTSAVLCFAPDSEDN